MKNEKEKYFIDVSSIATKYEKIEISLDIFAGDVTLSFKDIILELFTLLIFFMVLLEKIYMI